MIPEGMACDVIFVATVSEACYVDSAAFSLFFEPPGVRVLSPCLSFRASLDILNPSKTAMQGWKVADAACRVLYLVRGKRERGAFRALGTAEKGYPA